MEIIAEITRPGFAKLSIGDYSLCPLSEGSQGGVREAAVAAVADLPAMPDLVAQNCQLTLSAITLKTPFPRSMHYERAPRFPRSKLEGRRLRCAALRCAVLRSATAALGSKWSGVSGAKGLQQSIGKSAGEWHFTLGGEVSIDANDLSPKEATAMSGDIKYIGMDIHKEAIVIAVLNGSGKLVMETVVETKASSILEFLHGLRGELHVTWEEGTWAAWLYDLLQPQVEQVVVCNPRRNALLKEGSKSDKVD